MPTKAVEEAARANYAAVMAREKIALDTFKG
jgi:hypothetical protein